MITHEIKPHPRYEHSTYQPSKVVVSVRPLSRHVKVCLIIGTSGMGLWAAGWFLQGTASLGFFGLCIVGIAALLTAWGNGGGEPINKQRAIPAPPTQAPRIVRAWRVMLPEERAKAWTYLTTEEKVLVAVDTFSKEANHVQPK